MKARLRTTALGLMAFCLANARIADPRADDASNPKIVKMIIGSDAGGGYDAYGRLLARFLGRHLPGGPDVVAVNMPGAASVVAANYLAQLAPKDGSELLMVVQTIPLVQTAGGSNVKFDLGAFNWIGSMADDANVLFVKQPGRVERLADLWTTETIVGATAPSAIGGIYPEAMNRILGTRIRIIYGYKSGADVDLALQKGELDGRAGASWSSLKSLHADWVRDRRIAVLLQIGERKEPDLANVPLLTELARSDAERATLQFYSGLTATARAIAAPPGVTKERVAVFRKAFDATMRDQDLLGAASLQALDIRPIDGSELQTIVQRMIGDKGQPTPPSRQ
jgi:tripartite-type tricarboxylate transporter receptor subunit TctC